MSKRFNYFPSTPWTNPNRKDAIEKQTNEFPTEKKTETVTVKKEQEKQLQNQEQKQPIEQSAEQSTEQPIQVSPTDEPASDDTETITFA